MGRAVAVIATIAAKKVPVIIRDSPMGLSGAKIMQELEKTW
jgi:hypothetical protein